MSGPLEGFMAESTDIVVALFERNLLDVLDSILEYCGFECVRNMLRVCSAWKHFIERSSSMWSRLLRHRMRTKSAFGRLCNLNGWADVAMNNEYGRAAFAFYAATDLRNQITSGHLSDGERYFVGGMVTALYASSDLVVCGLISGHIKVWTTSTAVLDSGAFEDKAVHLLVGHEDAVTCVDVSGRVLASGAHDMSVRLWDLDTGAPMRVLKSVSRYLDGLSLTSEAIVGVFRAAISLSRTASRSRAVLWTVKTWDDVQVADIAALDDPPAKSVSCWDLRKTRLAYAAGSCVRVIDADVRTKAFIVVCEINLEQSDWVRQIGVVGSLLVVNVRGEQLSFRSLPSGSAFRRSLATLGSQSRFCLTSYALAVTDADRRAVCVWPLEDVTTSTETVAGGRKDLGWQRNEICFERAGCVVVTAKALVFLDEFAQAFHVFAFSSPIHGEDLR